MLTVVNLTAEVGTCVGLTLKVVETLRTRLEEV